MTTSDSSLNSQRLFKKTSPNSRVTMFLASRDLVVEGGSIDKVQGVLQVDPVFLENKRLYSQITLTFRYGREDEEVMGLKCCNEAIMSLSQVWPHPCNYEREPNTPLQDALIKRLGSNAYPFHLEMTPLAPPSVQLVPAKQYHGAPIGTSYDVRAFIAERADEKVSKRNIVRMGIRVLQGAVKPTLAQQPALCASPPPAHLLDSLTPHHVKHRLLPIIIKSSPKLERSSDENSTKPDEQENIDVPPPRAAVEKPFLLSDGRVELEAWLDKAVYSHGEPVQVSVNIINNSSKTVRRIKALVVQYVDVCMFSNGKFKNVVALTKGGQTPVLPGQSLKETYTVVPHRGITKNWIAVEDSYSKSGASLASTVLCNSNSPEDRNVFAIYVSYYVKVKLTLSAMGGELSVKLPFTLTHSCINEAPTDSVIEESTHKMILEGKENSADDETEDDMKNTIELDTSHIAGSLKDTLRSPEHHKVVTNVLINVQNTNGGYSTNEDKITRKIEEAKSKSRKSVPNDEELNVILKYPETDT